MLLVSGCWKKDIGVPDQEHIQSTVKALAIKESILNFPLFNLKFRQVKFSDYFVGPQMERTDENGIKQQVKKVSITCRVPFSYFIPGSIFGPSKTYRRETIMDTKFLFYVNERGEKIIERMKGETAIDFKKIQ